MMWSKYLGMSKPWKKHYRNHNKAHKTEMTMNQEKAKYMRVREYTTSVSI